MKFIYSIIISMAFWSLGAQSDPAAYTLTADTIIDVDQPMAIASTLVKNGSTLTWTQSANGNSQTGTFTIIGVSGSWNSNDSTGQLTYTLDVNSIPATLVLTGDSNGINAELTISATETDTYVFPITAMNYQ